MRIATARKMAGLSQTELGRRVYLSQETIAGYEKEQRQPKFAVVERIAAATNTRPEWIAFGVGPGPDQKSGQ
ncbi:helix-turn-helix transcriptional regulator [Telmatospirillum sp.]|uniref:helix-turn-helix domain-containing protein n=1 Tax=Telmatospirillum sp. TaxID=2079197 RepID=UPI0028490DB7|nr:helix-turn-helix transcriptional regulator [Telmatospirillum sp.]MDR3438981.1 helix-turn-helix transcriptional regulator [Telmatospirillum sp.]